MAKKGVHKIIDPIAQKMRRWIHPDRVLTQDEKLQEARERMNEMIRVLGSVDFDNSKLDEAELMNGYQDDCQDAIQEAIRILQQPEIAADDMSRIDNVLLYACYALEEAVKTGQANVVDWSLYCLAKGLRDVRRDIANVYAPDPEMREKQIQAKADWFENYQLIISGYIKYDNCNRAIHNLETETSEAMKEFNGNEEKLEEFLTTPEGQIANEKLKDSPLDPDAGNKDIRYLKTMMNTMRDQVIAIKGLNVDSGTRMDELETLKANVDSARQALTGDWHLDDPLMEARFQQIREDRIAMISKRIHDTAEAQKNMDNYADQLDAVLRSSAAQASTLRAVRFRNEYERMRKKNAETYSVYEKKAEERKLENDRIKAAREKAEAEKAERKRVRAQE